MTERGTQINREPITGNAAIGVLRLRRRGVASAQDDTALISFINSTFSA
jgi:hypothetical protein